MVGYNKDLDIELVGKEVQLGNDAIRVSLNQYNGGQVKIWARTMHVHKGTGNVYNKNITRMTPEVLSLLYNTVQEIIADLNKITQPIAQPVAQPVVQVAQPVVQPIAQPVAQPIAQPVAQPMPAQAQMQAIPVAPHAPTQPPTYEQQVAAFNAKNGFKQ